tara:strand:- start:448 stop:684 length:237 start_codon:yes stop_codon:yes gene_type:complete
MASQKNGTKPGDILVTPTSAFVIGKDGKRTRISTAEEQRNIENLRKRMRVIQQELDMAQAKKLKPKPKAKVAPKRKKK